MTKGWTTSARLWLGAIGAALLVLLGAAAGTLADPPQGPDAAPPPAAPDGPRAIPANRAARNVIVITVRGEIDEWTLHSVDRRIALAKQLGADGVVLEVDSPGGSIMPCILISQHLKQCPVQNTVAWVNNKAYSGGAIVALACKDVVVADSAVLGDAIPIEIDVLEGLKKLGPDEREKLAAPVMGELIDSARRNGYDENLVQGMLSRGVELWLVENTQTGRRLFVTEGEYKLAVGEAPDRLTPTIHAGTNEARPNAAAPRDPSDAPPKAEPTDFKPASPSFSPDMIGEVNHDLWTKQSRSQRPDFKNDPTQRGQYRPIEYVSDGRAVIILHESELLRYRLASQKVRSDDELKAYFGAQQLTRLDENWAEHSARFLSSIYVKLLLIVVFLVALFVEMTHPGLSLPGGIAALCLVGLVMPSILAGLAGWWTLAAIIVGIVLIGVELFLTPGVVVFGAVGALLLFGGLVGTFLITPGAANGAPAQAEGRIAWALATVIISLIVAGILIGVLMRFLPQVPMLRRLILTAPTPGDEAEPGAYTQAFSPDHPIKIGMAGKAITPLRPAGRIVIGDRIVDAVADGAFIEAGEPVKVLSSTPFRTTVERA